jgi:hypothetical protein
MSAARQPDNGGTPVKRLLLAAVLLAASLIAGAQQMVPVFGPQTLTVRRNAQDYGPVAVQPNITAFNVSMSAANWPTVQPVTVTLLASFDGGATWPASTSITTTRPTPNPKTPAVVPPVQISIGWNQEIQQATHVMATSDNPNANFSSTVKIDALLIE